MTSEEQKFKLYNSSIPPDSSDCEILTHCIKSIKIVDAGVSDSIKSIVTFVDGTLLLEKV